MPRPELASLLLALVSLVAVPLRAAAQDDSSRTDSERKELAAIAAEFRRLASRPEQRLALIERTDKLGPNAVDAILRIVHEELLRPLADYRQQVTRAATELAAARSKSADASKVAEIRADVLALSKDDELTERQIKEVGDAGLEELKKLLVPPVTEVLRQHPQLKPARQQLQTLGKQWEKCATLIMLAEDPKSAEPPLKKTACVDGADELLELDLPAFDQYLTKDEELAMALAIPMDAATRQILNNNNQLSANLDSEELRCVLDLNVTRILLGLAPLRLDPALAAAARGHSADMQQHDFFGHESPLPGKKMPWDRAKIFGATANAENIAVGTIDGAVINAMLWHSPSHHKNLVGDYARVGAGRHGKHWTELFGR